MKKDLTGKIFKRLKVLTYAGKSKWNCRCICKRITKVNAYSLLSGKTKSCGCLRIKHGLRKHKYYGMVRNMFNRCNNPKNKDYHNYGGRKKNPIKFKFPSIAEAIKYIETLGPRPLGHTIDRKDNDGHYEIGNLRWATRAIQAENKRKNKNCTSKYKYIYYLKKNKKWAIKYKNKYYGLS